MCDAVARAILFGGYFCQSEGVIVDFRHLVISASKSVTFSPLVQKKQTSTLETSNNSQLKMIWDIWFWSIWTCPQIQSFLGRDINILRRKFEKKCFFYYASVYQISDESSAEISMNSGDIGCYLQRIGERFMSDSHSVDKYENHQSLHVKNSIQMYWITITTWKM